MKTSNTQMHGTICNTWMKPGGKQDDERGFTNTPISDWEPFLSDPNKKKQGEVQVQYGISIGSVWDDYRISGSIPRSHYICSRISQTIISAKPVFAPIRSLPPFCLKIAYGFRDIKTVL